MTWIVAHLTDIAAFLGLGLAAGHIFVKLTPTTKDDEVLAAVEKALVGLGVKVPEQPK